jgi:hypothetical protein
MQPTVLQLGEIGMKVNPASKDDVSSTCQTLTYAIGGKGVVVPTLNWLTVSYLILY